MPRRAPWFKWNAHWALTDPLMASLPSSIIGGIVRLASVAWGDGSAAPLLPADEQKLRAIAQLTESEWKMFWPDLERSLDVDKATGRWYFVWQMTQWNEMQESYERRASAGHLGGEAKAAGGGKKRAKPADEWLQTQAGLIWQNIRTIYPDRAGGQSWRRAESHYRAWLTKKVDAHAILAGVQRYAEFIHQTGKVGTEYVKQAATFLGRERCWEEPWTLPRQPLVKARTAGARQFGNLVEEHG